MQFQDFKNKPKMAFKFYLGRKRWEGNVLASEALERRDKMKEDLRKKTDQLGDLIYRKSVLDKKIKSLKELMIKDLKPGQNVLGESYELKFSEVPRRVLNKKSWARELKIRPELSHLEDRVQSFKEKCMEVSVSQRFSVKGIGGKK